MQLTMRPHVAEGYKSRSQIARRITERWGADNLYCAACDACKLEPLPPNQRAADYSCQSCHAAYQLKSSARWNERRVPDAAYEAMMSAIAGDRTPNLLVMQYTPEWRVSNLLLVPSFFFTASAIEKRKPLGPSARRAGWLGCNILLSAIPPEGKLPMVANGVVIEPSRVRAQYTRIKPLSKISVGLRGWTLDVLRTVHSLGRESFSLQDIYALEPELAKLHADNRNIRPKIRQQLQVLRDSGLLEFNTPGHYSLRS